VTNTGDVAGDEVVQCYVADPEASVPVPVRQLAGFDRIHLAPGETQRVTFTVAPKQMSLFLDDGRRVVESGTFELFVGGGQPGTGAAGVAGEFTVAGNDVWDVPAG